MTIGQRIKKVRLHRGLTQKQLGLLVGFSENSAGQRIEQYESSSRKPNADTKARFSEVLKMNLRYFYMSEDFIIEDIILILLELGEELQIDLTPTYGKSRTRVSVNFDYEVIQDFLVDWMWQKQALIDKTLTKEDYKDWALTCSALIK